MSLDQSRRTGDDLEMLRIGSRSYDFVLSPSGFSVIFYPPSRFDWLQDWMLEAHYVPAATLPTRDDGQWEYLRLTVQPFDFQANDWRELTGFRHVGAPDELDPDLDYCTVENLLAKYDGKEETHEVSLDEIAVKPVDDYLFNVELAGIISYRGDEENLHLVEQLPFAEAILHVPINTTDPIAAARAKVAQAIGLKEIESARVVPADWRRKKDPAAPLASNHSIALTTRWRNHGA